MVRWDREAKHAQSIARYSLGSISLGQLAKETGLTALGAMQLLTRAGFVSKYSLEDYTEDQKLLDEFLSYHPPESTEGSLSKKSRATKD